MKRPHHLAITIAVIGSMLAPAMALPAQASGSCWEDQATDAYLEGFTLQQKGRTKEAVVAYERCLKIEPDCVPCNYEIGWSHWVAERWERVVRSWETVLKLQPNHPEAAKWLTKARAKQSRSVADVSPPAGPARVEGEALPTCKAARAALVNAPEKPRGRTYSGRRNKPDPSGMQRVGPDDHAALPASRPELLPAQPLEGPRSALARIRSVFRRGDSGERVRMSVYGASHTSADHFTGRLRELLQQRWGDGGKGHMLPGPLYKWYGGQHISTCWSDGWLSDWQGKANAHKDGRLGPAGMSVSSSHPEEFGWLEVPHKGSAARGVSVFEIHTLAQPEGGRLEYWIDNGTTQVIDTESDSHQLQRTRVEVPDGVHRITFSPRGDGDVRIFSVSMERDQGAIVDAMGVRGLEARTWLHWDEQLFTEGVRALATDLVVLAYGTNEAADQSYSMDRYRSDLREVLGKMRRSFGPEVACILAGPSDRGWDWKDGSYSIWSRTKPVAEVQRQVAAEFDCAFWDWQQATGGEGSMIAWRLLDPPLTSKDLIHHNRAGYRLVADRFLAAIDALR